jgi:ribosome-associated protein
MSDSIPQAEDLFHELIFTTSRSGGPGGQNVNKVNSKVTLRFDVIHSSILNEDQKNVITQRHPTKITREGVMLITSQDKRTQLDNKAETVAKFNLLLKQAFTLRKKRKATKPGKAATKRRINDKKQQSEKKQWRQKPG